MSGYPQTPTFPIDLRGGNGIKVRRTGPTANTIVLDAILGNDALAPMAAGTLKANLLGTASAPQDVTVQTFLGFLGLKGAAFKDVGVPGGVPSYDDPRFGTIGAPTVDSIVGASTTGRAILKGTAAQGRTALELGAAALLGVGAGGGVALYDDPRFSNSGGNPSYDPNTTGSRSRTFTQISGDRVNLFNFLSDAMRNGTVDAGPGIRAACSYARSAGKNVVYVPAFTGEILVNTTCDLVGIHLMGDGKVTVTMGAFACRADVTMFTASEHNAAISGLRMDHYGEGKITDFPRYGSYIVCDNIFYGIKSSAVNPLFAFGGSNYYFDRNNITNLRANQFTFHAIRSTDDICINNRIWGNYWGGPAKGILVGSTGNYVVGDAGHAPGTPIHRQEGLDISGNQYLMTGGECVYIQSVLNCRISNNMWDQGSGLGGVVLAAQGTIEALSIDGVLISNNYISCTGNPGSAACVRHIPTSNVVNGVSVVNNQLCFAQHAGIFGDGANGITFSGNYIHSIYGVANIRTNSPDTARKIVFDNSNIWVGWALTCDGGASQPGDFRYTNSVSSTTSGGEWSNNGQGGKNAYLNIPHRLPFAPGMDSIRVQVRTAGDFCDGMTAFPVGADGTNVTVKVCVVGIINQGTVTVAILSAINAKNA